MAIRGRREKEGGQSQPIGDIFLSTDIDKIVFLARLNCELPFSQGQIHRHVERTRHPT